MNRIIKVAIIGLGGRGGEAYGRYVDNLKDMYDIVSICDIDPVRLNKYKEIFEVKEENAFLSEDEFFKEKRADILFVCTQDQLHVRMAKKGLLLGYDLLLEKPISDKAEELNELVELQKKTGRTIMVCHVLRYTTAVRKLKSLLNSGIIGQLVSIDHTENVVYWHEAHSYVRGNWAVREETTPMIMAKCCHDLDLLQYYIGSKATSVASMGSLFYFKKENKPEGAADRCTKCRYVDSCTYSAKRIYIDSFIAAGSPENLWPHAAITDAYPITVEALYDSLNNGRYGRCVFSCENNVVDNQTSIIQFENGVTATLKMEAFVRDGGRDTNFYGTLGEIIFEESKGIITVKTFKGETTVYNIKELEDELGGFGDGGHGGGDGRMIIKLYNVLTGKADDVDTSIESSCESHFIAVAAEESRLEGGALKYIKDYRK